MSLSATVVAIGAARVQHDPAADRLTREGELLGLPLTGLKTKRYLFGAVPIGDAFLAWSASARPSSPPSSQSSTATPPGGAPLALVLWLPALILWLFVRFRRRAKTAATEGEGVQRITARNARFQVRQAVLTNRTSGSGPGSSWSRSAADFACRGQRVAGADGHHDAYRPYSRWAQELLQRLPDVERVAMAGELLAELGEKDAEPELIAVLELPADDLDRIEVRPDFLGVVFDRPTGPGNIGSIIRSADAFGAHGVIVTGHAADVYDPKAVRATTGSLFAVPAVRVPSHREVLDWVRRSAVPIVVVGTDEHGSATCSTSTSPGRPAPDRQRDPWPERRLEEAADQLGPNPHHRLGQLAERRQRSNRRPLRDLPPAFPFVQDA